MEIDLLFCCDNQMMHYKHILYETLFCLAWTTVSCWPLQLVCAVGWAPEESFDFWQGQEIYLVFRSSRLVMGSTQPSIECIISVCICDFYVYFSLFLHLFSKEEPTDHPSTQWWPNFSGYTRSEEFPSLTFSSAKAETQQNVG